MEITLGTIADPLKDQLSIIDMTPEQEAEIIQLGMDADAISRLQVRDLITDTQATKARQKLMKKVIGLLLSTNRKENNWSR